MNELDSLKREVRVLRSMFIALLGVAGVELLALVPSQKTDALDTLTVHRLNVVEPDGTLRMVLAGHAALPGYTVKGRVYTADRPQAGMLFYNDEGTEIGGLIFAGRKNAQGNITDSGVSLSFDQYGCANQSVAVSGNRRFWRPVLGPYVE